jgi:hypothetical protein
MIVSLRQKARDLWQPLRTTLQDTQRVIHKVLAILPALLAAMWLSGCTSLPPSRSTRYAPMGRKGGTISA